MLSIFIWTKYVAVLDVYAHYQWVKTIILHQQHLFCCSYAAMMTMTISKGFDCVQIPFAMKMANGQNVGSHYCGNNMGLAAGNMICCEIKDTNANSCSNNALYSHVATRTPFQLNFRSDKWETAPEAAIGGQNANNGFMLQYTMDAINCNVASMVMG